MTVLINVNTNIKLIAQEMTHGYEEITFRLSDIDFPLSNRVGSINETKDSISLTDIYHPFPRKDHPTYEHLIDDM
jgi:hypothetical protein